MLVAAAFVPTPPLLVPAIAGGTAAADSELRDACFVAVGKLLAASPDRIVVVGAAPANGPHDGGWDWRGFGVPRGHAAAARLPLALAIGAWLLDTHVDRPASYSTYGVRTTATATQCATIGASLTGAPDRLGLVVCGDGSACRDEKAPGHLDPAAAPWDDAALTALRTADAAGLLALDAAIARRVMAAGRAPWQVMAGAAGSAAFGATIEWEGAPYGVQYVAGSWLLEGS